jgi:hypothetical protein
MKNIFLFPTDKPSRLHITSKLMLYPNGLMPKSQGLCKNQHIYITNSEEIKEGDWWLNIKTNDVDKCTHKSEVSVYNSQKYQHIKKIILTTDQDLNKDGVQAIDDDFLKWFVKNPSCEFVEVNHFGTCCGNQLVSQCFDCKKYNPVYKIIIPKEESKPFKQFEKLTEIEWSKFKKNPFPSKKEEPKQETIDEAASRLLYSKYPFHPPQDSGYWKDMFLEGVKWLEQRMYSKEDLMEFFIEGYKQRAESSNMIFDDASRLYAIHLFNEQIKKK